jgi:phage FluMu protein Com
MSFTEELLLPSRGIIYRLPEFDGNVKVKPFTTKSYKDLLSANASETGIRQFVDTCLVDCPVKAKDMHQEDILAILFKTREMTLGNIIKMEIKCPECNSIENLDWDLGDLEINYLYVDKYPIPITLPKCGKEISIRFPTGADINKAKQEADRRASKFKKPMSEFLQIYTTVSLIDVDGKDIVEKAEWYENLNPCDAIYIDDAFSEMGASFGVKMTHEVKCSKCDKLFTTYIDIGSDFFRSTKCKSLGITSKKGNLAGAVKEPDIPVETP